MKMPGMSDLCYLGKTRIGLICFDEVCWLGKFGSFYSRKLQLKWRNLPSKNLCYKFQKKRSLKEHAWEGGKRVKEFKNLNVTLWDAIIQRTD